MQEFYREFGQRVRAAREALPDRMTQGALAARLGLTRTSITNIEKGHQGVQLHTLVELAAILRVTPSELLPGVEVTHRGETIPDRFLASLDTAERKFVDRVVTDRA